MIASTISKFRNFGSERDTTKKKLNQIDRSLKDVEIVFSAYLSPFQSYRGLKKLERSILLRQMVHRLDVLNVQ